MNARTLWPISGGIKPAANKTQSNAKPIQFAGIPPELVFPLAQRNADAVPVVGVGQRVRKGELIARAGDEFGALIHASSSGEIIAIEARAVAHAHFSSNCFLSNQCLVVRTDGRDEWIEREPIGDISNSETHALIERIRGAGVVGAGGAGFPAAHKLLDAENNIVRIETLIINGAECEPYITADDRLMRERADDIVRGIHVLAQILNPEKILIGIEDEKIAAIEAMRTATVKTEIEVQTLPSIYPMGGEGQIIQALTGKEVPTDANPAAIGVLCFNVGTVAAIYRATILDEPVVSRIVTISGRACAHNGNFDVLIGTPLSYVLQQAEFNSDQCARLIAGGPFMGAAADSVDIPILKTSHCFIAGSAEEFPLLPSEQACIRCGFCSEACPVQLLPQQLHAHARLQDHEQLRAHDLFDCIECGACDYVCPSSIPLVQSFRAAKRELQIIHYEQQQAPQAKARFIAHQARITHEQNERDMQRQQRLESAGTRKSSGNNSPAIEAEQNEPDNKQAAIQAAIARVKAKKNLGTQRLAVAAALDTTESIAERLHKRIAEIETLMLEADTQRRARLQRALDDLRSHLAEAEANPDATLDEEKTRAVIEQALTQVQARGDQTQ